MMMLGGGLMLVMGLLVMLLVFGLPILLIAALAGGMSGLLHRQNRPTGVGQSAPPVVIDPLIRSEQAVTTATDFCSHCGAGLQTGWNHCPQCGAPIR